MVQAAVLDGLLFNSPPLSQDGFAATEVDVGRGQVADAFVVTVVVVVVDEGGDCGFKFPFEQAVFEQDALLEGLVPALDFALLPGMHRRAANMFHVLVLEVFGQIPCNMLWPRINQWQAADLGRGAGDQDPANPTRTAPTERLYRALQPDGSARVAGPIHHRKHRGGTGSGHAMAMDL